MISPEYIVCHVFIVIDDGDKDKFWLTYNSLNKYSNIAFHCILLSEVAARFDCFDSLSIDFSVLPKLESNKHWVTLIKKYYSGMPSLFVKVGCIFPEEAVERLLGEVGLHKADAVNPLLSWHPYYSAFESGCLPEISARDVDKWINRLSGGQAIDVPLLSNSVALIQGDSWIEAVKCESVKYDLDLFQYQLDAGSRMVLTNTLYVDDSKVSAPDTITIPFRDTYGEALLSRHPLTGLRHSLTQISQRRESAPQEPLLPVRLHITHSWGGGLGRWVEDFVEADDQHHTLVLRSIGVPGAFGQSLALYDSAEMNSPLKLYSLSMPVLSTSVDNYLYESALQDIINKYHVSSVMVSSLIGHGLYALSTSLPTLFVFHDFYPFCPAIVATFDNPCISCDKSKLAECRKSNHHHRFFLHEHDAHWLRLREKFCHKLLASEIAVVAPSHSVVNRVRALAPALSGKPIDIIEHGLPDDFSSQLKLPGSTSDNITSPLKIVVLGSMSTHKGAALLKGIISKILPFSTIFFLGAGEDGSQFRKYKNVSVVKYYKKESLPELLKDINPDVGILLSLVPETFSYTLSELWAAGVPVLATRLGAFEDRINNNNGWLIEISELNLYEKIKEINADRGQILERKKYLQSITPRSSKAMVSDYNRLEKGLFSRLGFYPGLIFMEKIDESGNIEENERFILNRQAPFRMALNDFLIYTVAKIRGTSRIPKLFKPTIINILSIFIRRY